jgi:hypothetical protein
MRYGLKVVAGLVVLFVFMGAIGTSPTKVNELQIGGGLGDAAGPGSEESGGVDIEDNGAIITNNSIRAYGGFTGGADGSTRGAIALWDGSGGNQPGYVKIASPNGTVWYLFAADDGTLRYHTGIPAATTDGVAVGSSASIDQEQVEDWAGGMATGNTETLIAVTYQDGDSTMDYVVDSNLHSYSWTSVDATDLKVGTVTQAYDADLDDLADGALAVAKIDFGTGDASYVWTAVGDGTEGWASATGLTTEEMQDIAGGMFSGNTENRISIEYQDADGTIDAEVLDDLSYYSWANVDATDLKVGTVTQAYSALLTAIAALAVTDGNIMVGNGSTWVAESGATARTSLGLTIGTNVQAYDEELGDVAGLTPTDGNFIVGDGSAFVAESGATARTSLGLAIGTDVQAYDAQLADVAGLAVTDGNIIVGDGANWVAESGATARTSLGLAIGTNVQAYDAQLADVAGLAVTDGNIIVGDGANFVAESGSTARASLGLGSAATRDAEDTLTNGDNLPDGAAITTYVTGLGYITNDSSVPKGDLSSDGALGFDWPDGDVAADLTLEAAPEIGCAENEITSITAHSIDVAGKSFLVFDLGGADYVSTFANPTAGQILTVVNIDASNALTLDDDTDNIDIQGTDNDVVLNLVGESYTLQYVTTDTTNKWVIIGSNPNAAGGGGMTSFTLSADSGSDQTIGDSNTLEVEGGDGIDTVAAATDKVTVAVDSTVTRHMSEGPYFGSHFLGGALPDEITSAAAGAGSAVAFVTATGGNYRLTAGTALLSNGIMYVGSTTSYMPWTVAKNCEFVVNLKGAAITDSGSLIQIRLVEDANNYIQFRLTKGTNSDQWTTTTCADSSATTNNTTSGYTSFATYKIACSTGHVKFYIDGVEQFDHTTNIPDGNMQAHIQSLQAANPGTAFTTDIDYTEIYQDQ